MRIIIACMLLAAGCGGSGNRGTGDSREVSADLPDNAVFDPGESSPPDTGTDARPGDVQETVADSGPAKTPGGLPFALPFTYTRPPRGEPLTPDEIAAFTSRITGFWKRIDFFTWAAETSAGADASTGYPDYLIWWHDFVADKKGDTVTFRASAADGGSHNNAEPTGIVLAAALAGSLLSDNEPMRYLASQYTRSLTACMKGFVYDDQDPIPHLIARNIVFRNHEFVLPSGKKKTVDYSEWYFAYEGWNADRFRYLNNPTWGDVWVTNKRSKDDLPYWFRVAAWLPYVIELAKDPGLVADAKEALGLLEASARDIVDSGYKIRTKDKDGKAFVPPGQDLASFVDYVDLIPDAECDARLASALLGYGKPLDIDCGSGQGSAYDAIACTTHYFNYDIVNHFHQVAALLALTKGHAAVAEALIRGLAERLERYRDPESGEPGQANADWERDMALFLLRSAVVGLPLTDEEARLIVRFHDQTVAAYQDFPNWNLWDPSVPDGSYSFRDGYHPKYRPDAFRIEDVTTLLEYCWSPFRNPAGARFVDCAVVADPTRW